MCIGGATDYTHSYIPSANISKKMGQKPMKIISCPLTTQASQIQDDLKELTIVHSQITEERHVSIQNIKCMQNKTQANEKEVEDLSERIQKYKMLPKGAGFLN